MESPAFGRRRTSPLTALLLPQIFPILLGRRALSAGRLCRPRCDAGLSPRAVKRSSDGAFMHRQSSSSMASKGSMGAEAVARHAYRATASGPAQAIGLERFRDRIDQPEMRDVFASVDRQLLAAIELLRVEGDTVSPTQSGATVRNASRGRSGTRLRRQPARSGTTMSLLPRCNSGSARIHLSRRARRDRLSRSAAERRAQARGRDDVRNRRPRSRGQIPVNDFCHEMIGHALQILSVRWRDASPGRSGS